MNTIFEIMQKEQITPYQKAKRIPRDYTKQSDYKYKPEQGRFKLVVWFKDGNTRYFYSYDVLRKFKDDKGDERRVYDEYNGLMKLFRMVHKWEGKYKNAIIYMTGKKWCEKPRYDFNVFQKSMNGEIKNMIDLPIKQKDFHNLVDLEKFKVQNFKNGRFTCSV
tara:strand:- start:1291 stop:1779 length:489 start_codon:yes stop_codon:yes gene_type:complete